MATQARDLARITQPLRALRRQRQTTQNPEILATMATMSRPRYVAYLMVTLFTSVLAVVGMVCVLLAQNERFSAKFFTWGQTAACTLEFAQNLTDAGMMNEESDSATKPLNWETLLQYLLWFSNQCGNVQYNTTLP